jgi:hypothetical protein
MEASSTVSRGAEPRRQPAYGAYIEHPEVDAQHERAEGISSDELGRAFQLPFLIGLALLQVVWLVALAYVVYRFALNPLLG